MKKKTKTLLIVLLTTIMCFNCTPVNALAEGNDIQGIISPRWSHLSDVAFSFTASSTGGHVNISYLGYSSSFEKADIHVKLQKKFLLVFWTDVDEWNMSSTEIDENYYHCFTLDGTGTYKATMTFTVTGTDGTVDTVTDSIESKYSN